MNTKQIIRKKIQQKELQIKQLNYHQTSSEVCSQLYNTLIMEKAILNKELDELNKNPIVEAVKNVIPRKEKRICDYFKSSQR